MAEQNVDIRKLQQTIQQRYEAALAALRVVESYISQGANGAPTHPIGDEREPGSMPTVSRAPLPGSFRERVLNTIQADFLTVKQIAERAGVEEKTVRGVLYAKAVALRLDRRTHAGVTSFKLRADTAQEVAHG